MAAASPAGGGEKKPWWLTNKKKMVKRYVREARMLIAKQERREVAAALRLLQAALALAPRMEAALELKARCLLHLRRFVEVADMLQDYIPSFKMADDSSSSSSGSSSDASSNRLLSAGGSRPAFKCFSSVSDLKRKVVSGLFGRGDRGDQWRYSVLGQACCHLGLMEDAMVLLQTAKRLAAAASRRMSISLADDTFSLKKSSPTTPPPSPPDTVTHHHHLLSHLKLLLRRRAAALAALDAGLHSEAIRYFSKILDGRRGAPHGFLAKCYTHRAAAYRSSGRLAESIADCNRALALDASSTEALATRAALFESIRCLPDSLHDLEHLRLLYNSILRNQQLPRSAWRPPTVHHREIPGRLCSITAKIQQLKKRVAAGDKNGDVDYHSLIGIKKGCSRAELERAHLLLTLKHQPDRSLGFIDKCEFADEKDVDSVRDRAKMSALRLYKLLRKGYHSVMVSILEEEESKNGAHQTSLGEIGSGQIKSIATSPALVFQGAIIG